MGTVPQPPAAPVAPQPTRTGSSNVVTIVLLILALIVVVSAVSVWVGLRFLSQTVHVHVDETKSGEKAVSVQTPVGTFEAAKDVNEASLGLPIYPGAKRIRDKGSVSLNFDFPGAEGVHVMVAKYETEDSLEKVRDFYKDRLGSEVTKFKQRSEEGKTVFEIKRGGQEKVVALSPRGSGTVIELVRVQESKEGTN
jgi:hypothetical protein